MVERFNDRISELLPRPALRGAPPNSNKRDYFLAYNHFILHRPSDIDFPLTPSQHGMLNTLDCSLLQS
jgi:hypothetical protein